MNAFLFPNLSARKPSGMAASAWANGVRLEHDAEKVGGDAHGEDVEIEIRGDDTEAEVGEQHGEESRVLMFLSRLLIALNHFI